jgi:hypothetical protein
MPERPQLRTSLEIFAEIDRLREEYGFAIGDFTDVLLEYATATVERVDAAIEERKQRGSIRARTRRKAEGRD